MNLCQQQIDFVFNRSVTEPAWYWQIADDEEDSFNGEDGMAAFAFIEALLVNPAKDLAPFTDS